MMTESEYNERYMSSDAALPSHLQQYSVPHMEQQFRAFLIQYFGIKRHARQFFAPWKRLYLVASPQTGSSQWNAWTFNIVSRVIGAIARATIMLVGSYFVVANFFFWYTIGLLLWPIMLASEKSKARAENAKQAQPLHILIADWRSDPDVLQILQRAELSDSEQELWWRTLTIFAAEQPHALHRQPGATSLASLVSLLSEERLVEMLVAQNLPVSLIEEATLWHWQEEQDNQEFSFWHPESIRKLQPVGVDWAYGFTPTLDQFARNLNQEASKSLVTLHARPKLLRSIADTFSHSNNTGLLLVGQPGIGKLSLCMSLAKHIAEKHTFPRLADHRVMLLDLSQVVGVSSDPGTQAMVVERIFAEATAAGNIILVIDNLHQFVSPQGMADFSHIFAKVNRTYRLKLLALSTYDNFRQYITANSTVMTRFELIHMKPTTEEETLAVLKELMIESEPGEVLITLPALKELIKRSNQLLDHVPNPEKSINLLELCLTSHHNDAPLTKFDIGQILTQKMGIPLGELSAEEKEKLQQLRQLLADRVVGQEQALDALASAVKRASLRLESREKTRGAFLFLGPTGVGKTETAKALAEIYFGSPDRMIRVDLGEYSSASSLSNLIGTPQESSAHTAGGFLTEAVRQQPYSVVLLDELEKAHPSILNALLTALDEGYLTDARGQRISFRHTYVIATSNAGSQLFFQTKSADTDTKLDADTVLDHLVKEKLFSPEFLNRFDGIIVYNPLTAQEVAQIIERKLEKLQAMVYTEHKVHFELSAALLAHIGQKAYNPQFGARHLERTLTDEVLNRVAEQLLQRTSDDESTLYLDV